MLFPSITLGSGPRLDWGWGGEGQTLPNAQISVICFSCRETIGVGQWRGVVRM